MSEKNHDTKLMAQEVLQASPSYNELMKRPKSTRSYADSEKSGDLAALGLLLADEYSYTSRDGKISTKAEDLESYKINQIKIESAEILEQNVRVISNYIAVETGKSATSAQTLESRSTSANATRQPGFGATFAGKSPPPKRRLQSRKAENRHAA